MKKLTGTSQSVLKTVHLLFIVLYFGGLTAVMVILGLKSSDSLIRHSAVTDLILYRLNHYLVYYSFLGLAATAIIYGLYTKWGILKHRWIIIKWVLLATLAWIYIIVFSPSINGIVSLSSGGLHSLETEKWYGLLIRKAITYNLILISILITIFLISTLKPFGRRNSDFLSENRTARISIVAFVLISAGFGLMGSLNLNRLRTMNIDSPDLMHIHDGNYTGEFDDGGGLYSVEVEVYNHTISKVEMKSDRKSAYVSYARPVTRRIIEKQTVLVDAVTGATTTSKCIMKAAEIALKKGLNADPHKE